MENSDWVSQGGNVMSISQQIVMENNNSGEMSIAVKSQEVGFPTNRHGCPRTQRRADGESNNISRNHRSGSARAGLGCMDWKEEGGCETFVLANGDFDYRPGRSSDTSNTSFEAKSATLTKNHFNEPGYNVKCQTFSTSPSHKTPKEFQTFQGPLCKPTQTTLRDTTSIDAIAVASRVALNCDTIHGEELTGPMDATTVSTKRLPVTRSLESRTAWKMQGTRCVEPKYPWSQRMHRPPLFPDPPFGTGTVISINKNVESGSTKGGDPRVSRGRGLRSSVDFTFKIGEMGEGSPNNRFGDVRPGLEMGTPTSEGDRHFTESGYIVDESVRGANSTPLRSSSAENNADVCEICEETIYNRIEHYVNQHCGVEVPCRLRSTVLEDAVQESSRHRVDGYVGYVDEVDPMEDLSWLPNDDVFQMPVGCKYCSLTSILRHHMLQHLQSHVGSVVRVSTAKSNLKRVVSTDLSCRMCEYVTGNRGDFSDHVTEHTGEFAYSCGRCRLRYPDMERVKSHYLLVHNENNVRIRCCDERLEPDRVLRGYACTACGYVQLNHTATKKHLNRKHPGNSSASVVEINMSKTVYKVVPADSTADTEENRKWRTEYQPCFDNVTWKAAVWTSCCVAVPGNDPSVLQPNQGMDAELWRVEEPTTPGYLQELAMELERSVMSEVSVLERRHGEVDHGLGEDLVTQDDQVVAVRLDNTVDGLKTHLEKHNTGHEAGDEAAMGTQSTGYTLETRAKLMSWVSRERTYLCGEQDCVHVFASEEAYTVHRNLAHKGLPSAQCRECNLTLPSVAEFLEHLKGPAHMDHMRKFVCCAEIFCRFATTSGTVFIEHINEEHWHKDLLPCFWCGFNFQASRELAEHIHFGCGLRKRLLHAYIKNELLGIPCGADIEEDLTLDTDQDNECRSETAATIMPSTVDQGETSWNGGERLPTKTVEVSKEPASSTPLKNVAVREVQKAVLPIETNRRSHSDEEPSREYGGQNELSRNTTNGKESSNAVGSAEFSCDKSDGADRQEDNGTGEVGVPLAADDIYSALAKSCTLVSANDFPRGSLVTDKKRYTAMKEEQDGKPGTVLAIVNKSKKARTAMLSVSKIRHLYKCAAKYCSYTTDDEKNFTLHVSKPIKAKDRACVYCLEEFNIPDMLVHHVRDIHGISVYQCPRCFYRAKTEMTVLLHIYIHHHKMRVKPYPVVAACVGTRKETIRADDVLKAVKPFVCGQELCSFATVEEEEFTNHLKNAHVTLKKSKCFYCNEKLDVQVLAPHFKEHNVMRYHCLICGWGTDEDFASLLHTCENHPERSGSLYIRGPCTSKMFQKTILPRGSKESVPDARQPPETNVTESSGQGNGGNAGSVENTDIPELPRSGEEKYRCGYSHCPFSTKDTKKLKSHVKMCYVINKKHILECSNCKDNFRGPAAYSAHVPCQNVWRYSCSLCDFQTGLPGYIKQHMISHHRSSYENIVCKRADQSEDPDSHVPTVAVTVTKRSKKKQQRNNADFNLIRHMEQHKPLKSPVPTSSPARERVLVIEPEPVPEIADTDLEVPTRKTVNWEADNDESGPTRHVPSSSTRGKNRELLGLSLPGKTVEVGEAEEDIHLMSEGLRCTLCKFCERSYAEMVHHFEEKHAGVKVKFEDLPRGEGMVTRKLRAKQREMMTARPKPYFPKRRTKVDKKSASLNLIPNTEPVELKSLEIPDAVKKNDRPKRYRRMYKCPICSYETKVRADAFNHLLRHLQYRPYRCGYCNTRFSLAQNCRRHLRSWHVDQEAEIETDVDKGCLHFVSQVVTAICTTLKSNGRMVCPLLVGDSWHCSYVGCTAKMPSLKTLLEHFSSHLRLLSFRCGFCSFSDNSRSTVKTHCRRVHEGKISVLEEGDLQPEDSHVTHTSKSLEEDLADTINDGSTYQCPFCPYQDPLVGKVTRHALNHYDFRFYSCGHCSEEFLESRDVEEHIENRHPKLRILVEKIKKPEALKVVNESPCENDRHGYLFTCHQCEYKTMDRIRMRHHCRGAHDPLSVFLCRKPKGGKGVEEVEDCVPMVTETMAEVPVVRDEKPESGKLLAGKFFCSYCDFMSDSRGGLESHWKSRHRMLPFISSVPNTMYQCPRCRFASLVLEEVKKHVTKHLMKYVCKVCGKGMGTLKERGKHFRRAHRNLPSVMTPDTNVREGKEKALIEGIKVVDNVSRRDGQGGSGVMALTPTRSGRKAAKKQHRSITTARIQREAPLRKAIAMKLRKVLRRSNRINPPTV